MRIQVLAAMLALTLTTTASADTPEPLALIRRTRTICSSAANPPC